MVVSEEKRAPSPWSYIRRLTPAPWQGWIQSRWPYLASLVVLSVLLGSLVLVERYTQLPRQATPVPEGQVAPAGAPENSTAPAPEDRAVSLPAEAILEPLRPVPGKVTQAYGWGASRTLGDYRFHTGVDLAARPGEVVRAALGGTVTFAATNDETGLTVLVKQADGSTALYGNLGRVAVKEGQAVQRGDPIGTAGSSAAMESAEPAHLHYEVLAGSEPVDPGFDE